MHADTDPRIVATAAARAELGRLEAEHGPLLLFLSGGCCDGSSPMCFPAGELLLGPHDLRIGDVDRCPFYIDAEQDARWNSPSFLLDIGNGAGSGMSLEGSHGLHFTIRAQPAPGAGHGSCASTGAPS